MKKLILFLFIISLNLKTKAQIVFCPPGAEWHYTFEENMSGRIENEKIVYTGDIMLGSDNVKVLSHRYGFMYINDPQEPYMFTYIKQKGDTVFMKNVYTQNSWQILYNFNVLAGQTWQTNVYAKVYTVTVDSVATVTANTMPLKRIFVTYAYQAGSLGSVSITERFGSSGYMFHFRGGGISDGDFFQEFLCYQDNVFGQKQFTSKPCDYVNYTGIKEENFDDLNIGVYPNPTNGIIAIEHQSGQQVSLRITNSLGQCVYFREDINSNQQLDLNFLSPGIYYLSFQGRKEQRGYKLVKE